MAIAKRAANGFDMTISYHNRQHRSDVPYSFCSTPTELARASDFLVVATPGGLGTRGLINKSVLEALGPNGFLINIARASVVSTVDLVSALEQRRIAGAALDVFDHEPQVPDSLKVLSNVVLTPTWQVCPRGHARHGRTGRAQPDGVLLRSTGHHPDPTADIRDQGVFVGQFKRLYQKQ